MIRRTLPKVLACVALASAGCKDREPPPDRSPAERVRDLVAAEPKVATYVSNLQQIQAHAAGHPELTALTSTPAGIKLTDWIDEEHPPGKRQVTPGRCFVFNTLEELLATATGKAVPEQTAEYKVARYAENIARLKELTHVFVCRQTKVVRAVPEGAHSFRGGFFEGECRAYDPWTRAYLGGFPLKAQLGQKTHKATGTQSQQDSLDWALRHAMGNEAHERAFGKPRPGNASPEFACTWPSGGAP